MSDAADVTAKPAEVTEPRLWFRVLLPGGALGPGKAALLEAISATGSISAGGRAMGMSYRRAWSIVEELNLTFGAPLVEAVRGGKTGGGARLSPLGRRVVALYRELEAELEAAAEPVLERLRDLKVWS